MATQNTDNSGANDPLNSGISDQELQQINYQDYLGAGGNPALAVLGPNNQITQGSAPAASPYASDPYAAYLSAATRYAPYDEGGGHTKWDEFIQQMNLEQSKLAQDKALKEEELAQTKAIEDARIAEQKYASQQSAVTDFDKELFAQQGPKDPYGYLFQSRGLASPQGYAPVAMPLSDAVNQAYQSQGVNLADAQKSIVGSAGPSFINGYLGGMPASQQQGPMGFENTPAFKNIAPGSQPQPGDQTNQQQPVKAAQGTTIPGYAPGQDTVPAMLSPGEGVLKPQTVRAMGGPPAIDALNAQHFADGGIVTPTASPPTSGTTRGAISGNPWDQLAGSGWAGFNNPGIPVWGTAGGNAAPLAIEPFGASGLKVTGSAGQYGVPITDANGVSGYMNPGDIQTSGQTYSLAGQPVGANTWENAPTAGYTMTSPGVASPLLNSSPTGSGGWVGEVEKLFGGGGGGPLPAVPVGSGFNPSAPSAPELTGGVLAPTAPAGQTPMNLNMLDPYTRSQVDQYGRPQTPSMQAWDQMPQSGKDAYTNYVEKVAGGNMQDLLDMQKQLTPQGDAAALRDTFTFK